MAAGWHIGRDISRGFRSAGLAVLLPPAVLLAVLLLAGLNAAPAAARDHLVAPPKPPPAESPLAGAVQTGAFASLKQALQSGQVQGGDRLVLAPGSYGRPVLTDLHFDPPVIIAPAPGAAVHLEGLVLRRSSGLVFRDLQIWPVAPPGRPAPLVLAAADTADLRFERLDIRGRADAPESYLGWTIEDWTGPWRSSGVRLDGTRMTLTGSRLTGLAHAISMGGPHADVQGNHVLGFSGDGIRALGDHGIYAGNRIETCFDVDANHDDGIQSWARTPDHTGRKTVTGLVIAANTILEWTGPPGHPLRCSLQGIGLFDGMFRDLTIRNNLVAVDNYHGITVYGADGAEILHNTVVHAEAAAGRWPWISLRDHKDGTATRRVVLANNAAMRIAPDLAAGELTAAGNRATRYPALAYRDVLSGDYTPAEAGGLRNAADPRFSLPTDHGGRARPSGGGPDIGAIEAPE